MRTEVFLLVLCAAVIHAGWNALVKADSDRLALIKIMSLTHLILSLLLLPFVMIPAEGAWPYLITSALVMVGYMLFLSQSYRSGDLSHVYPLARGVAPLIVAAISVIFLGEQLNHASRIAILCIGLGIISLSLTRGIEGFRDLRLVGFALGTGGFIATYTLLDGLGARAAESAHSNMVWVSLFSSVFIVCSVHWLQSNHGALVSRKTRIAGVASGLTSYVSSWMIIWAMTMAPIPLVSALRETSIIFALVIGVLFLKERLNLPRLASIAVTLIGTMILKFT